MANIGYVPRFTGPFARRLPVQISPSNPLSGNGAPDGSVKGIPGQVYRDLLTNNLYMKAQGVDVLGWILVGVDFGHNGSGGNGTVYYGSTDPNGVITAQRPSLYYNISTGALWSKTNSTLDSTGWEEIVAEP